VVEAMETEAAEAVEAMGTEAAEAMETEAAEAVEAMGTEAVSDHEETAISGDHQKKCTKQFAVSVIKSAKFHSNPKKEDLFIVMTVSEKEETSISFF